MRLLPKVTLYYLLISLLVFGIGGVMTYDIFKTKVQIETDRYLISRLWGLHNAVKKGESPYAFVSDNLSVKKISNDYEETRFQFSDTLADHPNPHIDRLEPHRKLTVVRKMAGATYKIEIFDVIIESDDILFGVFRSQTRLFFILGVVLIIASFLVSTWVFRPFYHTISVLRHFKLGSRSDLELGKSGTREFKELNDILEQLMHKARDDYRNLKEFSENASHEMQTPLAVAKGKLELLMQSGNLVEEQKQLINSAYNAMTHLSKMGRSLSLLTKIENREFSDFKEIDLSEIIRGAIFDFQELLSLKNISLDHNLQEGPEVIVKSDPVLIRTLIINLFQNAIRHNLPKGSIQIHLTESKLCISNTGAPLKGDAALMFRRFTKSDQSSGTVGLGLAIVKKICDVSDFVIDYQYLEKQHKITVTFDAPVV